MKMSELRDWMLAMRFDLSHTARNPLSRIVTLKFQTSGWKVCVTNLSEN